MFSIRTPRHRAELWLLKWWIVIKSHPLRVRLISSFLICAFLLWKLRHYLLIRVPLWIQSISHPIFVIAQTHPIFGRVLHVLFNAIPDAAFALLAVAGLAYLVPKSYLDRLEELVWVRIFLIVLFVTFGFAAIIINAVRNENQEYKDGQREKTLDLVLGDVNHIQDALSPKSIQMTETERRRHLLDLLRDQYVIEQKNVDPQIVAGNKMPPDDWLNNRLGELKENWQIHTPPIASPPIARNPALSISVVNITTQLPTKAGEDATASIQILVNGSEAKPVRMGELCSIYPVFPENAEAQRSIENTLWGLLQEHDKKSEFSPLALPVNNKSLAIPLKQANVAQESLDHFKAGSYAFYFMVHLENLKGKTLLDSCFLVGNKNQVQYCREHNGP